MRHDPNLGTRRRAVLERLRTIKRATLRELRHAAGLTERGNGCVSSYLGVLERKGVVRRVRRGVWAIVETLG